METLVIKSPAEMEMAAQHEETLRWMRASTPPAAWSGWLEPFDSSGQHAHKTLHDYQKQLEGKRKRKKG